MSPAQHRIWIPIYKCCQETSWTIMGSNTGFRVANHQSSPEEPWLWPASSLSERRELNRDGVGKGLGVHQEAKQPQKHRPWTLCPEGSGFY